MDIQTYGRQRVHQFARTFLLGGVTAILLLGAACSTSCIPTGHTGVVTTFGRVTGRSLSEGLNLVAPWQSVHDMSIRTQEIKEVADVPSNEGLIVKLEASLLFHLAQPRATTVYQTVGDSYIDVIVTPNFRSAMRAVTSAHKAEALYSDARDKVAEQVRALVASQLEPRGVLIERVLLRDIQLPATLKASIEAKQQMEQESQRMQFVLTKERQEAERKRVEAQGIKDFQEIVTQGISDKLLEWKGIEATRDLAHSSNTKVIVIGSGKNGLPIILGGS